MTDRLKSCPFCGGNFRINYRGAYEHDSKGCILDGLEIKNHKEIEQWNTRKPIKKIVEKLETWAKSSERLYFEYYEEECYGAWRSYNNAIKIVKREV